jgi:putative membrane protein
VTEHAPPERDETGATQPGGIRHEWRRLDPRMLLIHPFQALVRFLPALLAIFLARTSTDPMDRWELLAVPVVMTAGMARWFTTRYRIGGGQLVLRRGLFRRTTSTAPLDRVRTVDLTAELHHRALGLAKVEISTAGSSSERLVLDAMRLDDGRRLREELLHRALVERPEVQDDVLVRLDRRWVRYAPLTATGLATAAALLGFVGQGWNIIEEESQIVREGARQVRELGLLVGVVGAVVVVTALSVVAYVLTFWDFRLIRNDRGSLHVSRGLLTTRETSIDHGRLRGVDAGEPIGLRFAGAARLKAVTTGLAHGGRGGSDWLVPPAPRDTVAAVAKAVTLDGDALTAPLTTHGRTARRRRLTRALVPAVASVVGLWAAQARWDLPAGLLLAAPVVLVGAAALAHDRARGLGHMVTDRHLVTREGSLDRHRVALARDGVIGWRVERSYFQRRAGVVTLVATTAAGRQRYRLLDLEPAVAYALVAEVSPGLLEEFG